VAISRSRVTLRTSVEPKPSWRSSASCEALLPRRAVLWVCGRVLGVRRGSAASRHPARLPSRGGRSLVGRGAARRSRSSCSGRRGVWLGRRGVGWRSGQVGRSARGGRQFSSLAASTSLDAASPPAPPFASPATRRASSFSFSASSRATASRSSSAASERAERRGLAADLDRDGSLARGLRRRCQATRMSVTSRLR
jgi:hypothetical protein